MTRRRSAAIRVAACLLLLALIVPVPVSPTLQGIPWSQPVSFVAAAWALAAIACAQPIASTARGLRFRHWFVNAAVALSAALVILRITLSLIPAPGFTACYWIPVDGVSQTCLKGYASPTASDFTRIDAAIDFHGLGNEAGGDNRIRNTNWDLGGVNSLDYNFYGSDAPADRLRLPLAATWHGRLSNPEELTVRYVGEGAIRIDGSETVLQASYSQPRSISVVAESPADVSIDFLWKPNVASAGPYAQLQLLNPDGTPAQPSQPNGVVKALAALADFLAFTVLIGLVAGMVLSLGSMVLRGLAAIALAASVAIGNGYVPDPLLAPPFPTLVVVAALLASRWFSGSRRTAILAALALPPLAMALGLAVTHFSPTSVTYRDGGSDFLTYESHARSILSGSGLEAGEPVFIYSAGFRYLLFFAHLLLGDGDLAIVALSILALFAALWFFVERAALSPMSARAFQFVHWRTLDIGGWLWLCTCVLAVGLLVVFTSSTEVLFGGWKLLSEFPTWVFMLIALPLAVFTRSARGALVASALLGLMFVIRADQALGILLTLGVLSARRSGAWGRPTGVSVRWGGLLSALIPFAVLAALPGIHNWVFGHRLVLTATSLPLPVNFPLPPARLLRVFYDDQVVATLQDQLLGVFGRPTLPVEDTLLSIPFLVTVRAIQVSLAVLLVLGLARRFRGAARYSMLITIPIAFLTTHVFIQVYNYYPRHIIQGYLTGAAVIVICTSAWLRARLDGTSVPRPELKADADNKIHQVPT